MNRLLRSLQQTLHRILYQTLARHLPTSTSPGGIVWRTLRRWCCRPLFEYCGTNVNIERGAALGHGISIGCNSGIGAYSVLGNGVRIGCDVMMGPDVMIFTRNHKSTEVDTPMIRQGFASFAPVEIGDDVWIGARVIILPGVSVGSGSILGAAAVVTKSVPPGSVVVGNPGRVVRNRFIAGQKATYTS